MAEGKNGLYIGRIRYFGTGNEELKTSGKNKGDNKATINLSSILELLGFIIYTT